VLKHCAANRKRKRSALPNVGPYTYRRRKKRRGRRKIRKENKRKKRKKKENEEEEEEEVAMSQPSRDVQ
jgi:hypothetical protein